MPSEARLNFQKNCLIYVSKGVIWASEYSLGLQIWGPGGARAPGAPGPPLDPLLQSTTYLKKIQIDCGGSKNVDLQEDMLLYPVHLSSNGFCEYL